MKYCELDAAPEAATRFLIRSFDLKFDGVKS